MIPYALVFWHSTRDLRIWILTNDAIRNEVNEIRLHNPYPVKLVPDSWMRKRCQVKTTCFATVPEMRWASESLKSAMCVLNKRIDQYVSDDETCLCIVNTNANGFDSIAKECVSFYSDYTFTVSVGTTFVSTIQCLGNNVAYFFFGETERSRTVSSIGRRRLRQWTIGVLSVWTKATIVCTGIGTSALLSDSTRHESTESMYNASRDCRTIYHFQHFQCVWIVGDSGTNTDA